MALFNHILIPLDGSQLAEGILPHAVALSDADTRMTLIRVLQVDCDTTKDQPVNPLDWQIVRAEAESYLDKIASELRTAGAAEVNTIIMEGDPAQHIIEQAGRANADLILLSSHGKSGVSRWNVSSVVRKIIQTGMCSTMIVRAYAFDPAAIAEQHLSTLRYKRILIPLDGSVRSEVSLPAASVLAQKHGAAVVLAHVVTRPELIQRTPLTNEDRDLLEQLTRRAREVTDKYFDHLRTRMPVDFTGEIRDSSDIIHTLLQMTEDEKFDLVVLSAHGYSADPQRTYGNVTSGLIEYGASPTLVIQDFSSDEIAPSRAEEAAREHKGHT